MVEWSLRSQYKDQFVTNKIQKSNAGPKVPLSDCSPEGKEIIELLNAYREENGLPKIPKSCSLCTVANTKVEASVEYHITPYSYACSSNLRTSAENQK